MKSSSDLEGLLSSELTKYSCVATDRSGAGGRLFITNRHLLFKAHKVDKKLSKASDVIVTLDAIASVGAARMPEPYYGRLALVRNRVQVLTTDGSEYRFVVNRPKAVAAVLSACVRSLNERGVRGNDDSGGTFTLQHARDVPLRAPIGQGPGGTYETKGRFMMALRSWKLMLAGSLFWFGSSTLAVIEHRWAALVLCSALLILSVFGCIGGWRYQHHDADRGAP